MARNVSGIPLNMQLFEAAASVHKNSTQNRHRKTGGHINCKHHAIVNMHVEASWTFLDQTFCWVPSILAHGCPLSFWAGGHLQNHFCASVLQCSSSPFLLLSLTVWPLLFFFLLFLHYSFLFLFILFFFCMFLCFSFLLSLFMLLLLFFFFFSFLLFLLCFARVLLLALALALALALLLLVVVVAVAVVVVVVGCCWLLLVVVGCCWLLLVVVGCGCCWLLVVVGCCWLWLVVVGWLVGCGWLWLVVVGWLVAWLLACLLGLVGWLVVVVVDCRLPKFMLEICTPVSLNNTFDVIAFLLFVLLVAPSLYKTRRTLELAARACLHFLFLSTFDSSRLLRFYKGWGSPPANPFLWFSVCEEYIKSER